MTSKRMTRAEMIRWLGDAISTETEKPFEEIDYDFVEECGCLLDELMGKSTAMSEKEIADRMEKLMPDTTSTVQKKIGGRKLWKIVIAAAVVLCMSITVVAVSELRVILINVLQLDIGESIEDSGITYIYNGENKFFKNMDDLIAAENLDILSLDVLADHYKIDSISFTEDVSTTSILFNDRSISFFILHNQNLIDEFIVNNSELHIHDSIDVYFFSKQHNDIMNYVAYLCYKNDTYIITCSVESILHSIIDLILVGE